MGKRLNQLISAMLGDWSMTYDQVNDIYVVVKRTPSISVDKNTLAVDDNSSKAGTIEVSGTDLKADIVITASANWTVKVGNGAAASSVTLPSVGGVVAAIEVTVTYTGSGDTASGSLSIEAGTASKSVALNYSKYGVATIIVDGSTINLSEVSGYADAYIDLAVSGVLLEGDIVASVPSGSRFSIGTDGTKSATISKQVDNTASGTLRIFFHPVAGDSSPISDTLTLTSTGANQVTVPLSGTILTQTLSLSESALSFGGPQNTDTAEQNITVSGTYLKEGVTISLDNAYFECDTQSLTASQANAGATIKVKAKGTGASGTLTASSTGVTSQTVSLSWAKSASEGDLVNVDGINYRITAMPSGGTNGTCKVTHSSGTSSYTTSSYSGDVVIPDYITYGGQNFNVTMIEANAFYQSSVKSLKIGNNVTSIGLYMGFKSTSLESVEIGTGLATLGNNMFDSCSELTSVTLHYDGVVTQGNNDVFKNVPKPINVYVPTSALQTSYQSSSPWNSTSGYTILVISNN